MPHCFVSTCSNYYGKTRKNSNIMYHMFPTSPQIMSKWINLCRDDGEKPTPHTRVCSVHFSDSCYQRDLQHELLGLPLRRKLKSDAVPDLNLPSKCSKTKKQVLKTVVDVDQLQKCNKNKTKDNKFKAKKQQISISNRTAGNNIAKKISRNVTVIDITTEEPILRRESVIKELPGLRQAVKSKNYEKWKNKNGSNFCEQNNTTENSSTKKQPTTDDSSQEIIILDSPESIISVNTQTGNSKTCLLKSDKNTIKKTSNEESCNKSEKNNNKFNNFKRRPMRSSIRIAKKKSIESLSDSFTEKVNNKRVSNQPEQFSDKLKFMAKLQLKYEKNNYSAVINLDEFFNGMIEDDDDSLNKMQIMENVVEGGNVQPSSPGQADGRADEVQVKTETKSEELDNEATEAKEEEKIEEENSSEKSKIENVSNGVKEENDSNEVQDENYSNNSSPKVDNNNKRKSENPDYPIKRLKTEIQENFVSRDKIINDFIDMADCTNLDQINSFSEQLLVEIKTLNEFAREKEREWNNIIHLKKLKEELLLRMQRKKQILIINEKSDYGDFMNESQNGTTEERIRNASPQSILKSNQQKSYANVNGSFHRQKLSQRSPTIDQNGQGKRLTLDVQSIIADYRQRHPESVPRRGRRIRCSQNDGINKMNNSIINFSSMALGSGAQVKQGDVSNDLGLLLNSINMGRQDTARLQNFDPSAGQDTVSFKDMLLQFAKLSQNERNELIQNAIKPPPPYPEVTVHPVPTSTPPPTQTNSSLLHGILTKTPSKQNSKTSFSPTLARLLTAPERSANNAAMGASPISNSPIHSSNMSISEILSTSKACNEITITPVDNQYESTLIKTKNMEEEETEDSADRLVIDENNDVDAKKQTNSDNNSDGGDDIPLCQGCNQKPAQFVCAGCGNQWYCSRDCQVNAWDEHSEVCTG